MQDIFVDSKEGLTKLCQQLRGQPVLALDTEFMREKTYYAQLCLLQVAADGIVACVDPLALASIDPLLDIIYDPGVTKVLHSARQDMEIFFDLRGELPTPVFDTQIAATLLGFGDQVGYANLVQDMLKVSLDKLATRTDWRQRPLDDSQLHYAADDVRYLFQLYHLQVKQLRTKGRLDWLTEDFTALSDTRTYLLPPEKLWKKVKGTQRLKPEQLAVLRELAIWREERARHSNRPKRWVLKDEVMVDIARRMPEDLVAMEKIRGLEAGLIQKQGEVLLAHIVKARATPPASWPQPSTDKRLTPAQDALVDLLMAVLRAQGAEHDVSPALLATRKDLEAMVRGEDEVAVLHGWRGELAGHVLQSVLDGDAAVRVVEGVLTYMPAGQ